MARPKRSSGLALHNRPADDPSKTFDDINAHNSFATRPIAGDAIALPRYCLIERKGGPTRRCNLAKRSEERAAVARRLKTPQLKGQRPCRGLNQRRQKNVIGAETYAVLSELRSLGLVERLDLPSDRFALQNPERSGKPGGQLADDLRSFLQSVEGKERTENAPHHCRKPKVNSRLYNVLGCNWQGLVGQNYGPGG